MRLPSAIPALLAVVLLASTPVPATASDGKAVAAGASCFAYAPDTTAAELQVTTTGIYNPGTTIEKVMCAIPRDSESIYSDGNPMSVTAFYRVLGGASGRLTCTVYVGTSSMQLLAVTTTTASGNLQSGGGRGTVTMNISSQDPSYAWMPTTMVCAISPKTSFGSILVTETGTGS